MNTQTRNLHHQIMKAVTANEGTPLPRPESFVLEVTEIDPVLQGMSAVKGTEVAKGHIVVPIRSGVYLVRTFHRRGDQEIGIYNICVMDSAGEIRLLLDTRTDTRTPSFASRLRPTITTLLQEHGQLNYPDLSADHQVQRALDHAISLMPYWTTERWTEWATYLLEKLRDHADLATYEEFLEQVGDAIANRMVTGMW